MKDLSPFDFEPSHQPLETPVTFKLRPLDGRGRFEIKSALYHNAVDELRIGWEGLSAASRYIVGCSLFESFSRAAIRPMVDDPDSNWMEWLVEITGELYRRSRLEEAAAKKS